MRSQQADVKAVVSAEQVAELMAEGETIYSRDCATCHGADGSEGSAPALAGSVGLGDKDRVVREMLTGVPAKGMPPFAPNLTDRRIAAVATFVRGAWGNAFGAVGEADVKKLREAHHQAVAARRRRDGVTGHADQRSMNASRPAREMARGPPRKDERRR